jgi:hypothetical protein
MKLGDLVKKLRLRSVQAGDGQQSVENVDGMANLVSGNATPDGGHVPVGAPPGWVPSQQDWGRPKQ